MKRFKKFPVLVIAVLMVLAMVLIVGAEEGGKININTAVKEKLTELDKIGPKYAERIIEYREKSGPFEQAEDIMKVKGIGRKIYEANKDRIVVE
jgi:competence protein ComEA